MASLTSLLSALTVASFVLADVATTNTAHRLGSVGSDIDRLSRGGLAARPMMGWSTWNWFGCDINETVILDAARAIKDQGLLQAGYEYIAIDDCWQADHRDTKTGAPVANADKFPNGLRNLTSKLHDMGFKAGIYSSAGKYTCQRYFGSLDTEEIDAQTYADMGFDMLKYDNCYNEGRSGTPKLSFDRYKVMHDALKRSDRPIWYYICNWGEDATWNWASTIANSYRVTGDVGDNYDEASDACPCTSNLAPCAVTGHGCSVMNIIEKAAPVVHKSIPGSWADLDGLEVGNGGMTADEYRTQMSVWAAVKSPLMMGHDPTKSDKETLSILSNPHVIAVNQDPAGKPALRLWKRVDSAGGSLQLWKGPQGDGSFLLLVLNSTPLNQRVGIDLLNDFFKREIMQSREFASRAFQLYDLWQDGKQIGLIDGQAETLFLSVKTHGVRMLRVVPSTGQTNSLYRLLLQAWRRTL